MSEKEKEFYRMEDRIISALIGLVGACGSNPKTENTDRVVIKALAAEPGDEAALAEIYAEKNAVSPGCATCAMPCGNTSDYDMGRIYAAPAEIRDLKRRIIDRLRQAARSASVGMDCELIYKALAYVSYDLPESELNRLLEEIE